MKRLFSMMSVFMACTCMMAQEASFVQEGKTWQTRYSNGYHRVALEINHECPFRFFIEGDTLIGGKTCQKMYVAMWNDLIQAKYMMAVREEGRKVYFVPKDLEEECLMYDFGVKTGDVCTVCRPPEVSANGSVVFYGIYPKEMRVLKTWDNEYFGVKRVCMNVMSENEFQAWMQECDDGADESSFIEENLIPRAGLWIEGVGSSISPLDNTTEGMREGGGPNMTFCSLGEDTLYCANYAAWYEKRGANVMVDGGMVWEEQASPTMYAGTLEKGGYYFALEAPIWQNNKRCRLLRIGVPTDESGHAVAALFEEGGKVLFFPTQQSEEPYLLYDFTAQVGDELEVGVLEDGHRYEATESNVAVRKCRVDSVAYHEVCGCRRKHLYLSVAESDGSFSDAPTSEVCWIEGIGSVAGILSNTVASDSGQRALLKCRWLEEVFYQVDPSVLPTGVKCTTKPASGTCPKASIYHDLTGRRLAAPPVKGLWIENGVKRVK